jgi:hypothetical protein
MNDDTEMSRAFRTQLRNAVEHAVDREVDWMKFHARLDRAVAGALGELRRRASGGYRATATAGAAWWDYAAGAALAAVPLGLAAALILFTYLRADSRASGDSAVAPVTAAIARGSSDSARAAFESVLTGTAAPQAVMATLIPVPAAAFLAESAIIGGSAR